jgi:TetR/AcrR family transcriptional regulator, cholesterol catabolism regulator
MQNRIIETAESMFFRFGIRSVTMDDIAKELGISKKTIYHFFKDKDELVEKVTENAMSNQMIKTCKIIEVSKNPIEELIFSTRMMREMLETVNVVLFFDMKKYHPNSWKKYMDFKLVHLEIVKKNLTEGIKQKLYRSDLDVDIITKLRVETIDLAFNLEIFPPNIFNVLKVQLESIDHFIRGIVTQQGLEIYENTRVKI